MKKIKHPALVTVFNVFIVTLFLLLPYYLFGGRLFLGGDDTRLYYAYPREILLNFALYSWNNISSLSSYLPNHHSIPFLAFWSILDLILNSKVQLFYFAFSLPWVLGYIYFQKFIRELLGREYQISIISSLVYVLSPITVVTLSFFLTPVWLIALFPIIAYYYLCFINRGEFKDILKAVIWSIFLSIAYYTIPWIFGLLIPLFCGFIFSLMFISNPLKGNFKRTIIFGLFIASSQMFWVISFLASILIGGSTGLGEKITSKNLSGSFIPTVLGTAKDNIIYPLLTYYHRQINIDYNLPLKNVFLSYFDRVLPLSLVFIIVMFLGIIYYKKVLAKAYKKIFIFFFASFIAALFFSTVNIGFLKDVFLLFGYIPGFAVFRNFTDKFALGYIFIYSTFLSLCLLVSKKSFRYYKLLFLATLIVVLVNFIPVKQIITSPLWTTKKIYTTVLLPKEYLDFAAKVKLDIPNTSNIIGFPQTLTSYSAIVEENGSNAYVGTSPLRFFSGVNDLGGSYSYPPRISDVISGSIKRRDYNKLLKTLGQINVGYVMVTNNIPKELLGSYIYEKKYLEFQDRKLINAIADRKAVSSEKNDYVIYKLKNSPRIFSSNAKISFKKLSPVKYKIKITKITAKSKLLFLETFHTGWKLYMSSQNTVDASDFLRIFDNPLFEKSHKELSPYGNEWVIDPSVEKSGSKDIELILYFLPQNYFYIGVVITFVSLIVGTIYFMNTNKHGKK